ncbi:MAG: twin-arginine translocase TatA/TatE family subunit [Deltaproteobacteria bacterium]|nr:twin-arginine translocase TatA/TatE family subunit [Deltaproteobacteria bacterium]
MLHGWELIVVVLVVLLLFGAKKIPELGKGLGEGIRSFKKGIAEADAAQADSGEAEQVEGEKKDEEKDPKLLT